MLAVLEAAAGPLSACAISDASRVALSSTGNALAALRARGLVRRRRKGRTWLYRCKAPAASRTDPGPAPAT